MEPTYIQVLLKKTMLEAGIKLTFFLKVEVLVFILMYCMYTDIHTTKYSRDHEMLICRGER